MKEQNKSNTVPYLSASKMEKVLELVSERSLNNITTDYFKTYSFGPADAYLAVNTLKFLGVIDENGKATDCIRKFQLRGDARNKEVEAVVREAYKKLFEATEKPYDLPKDDLANEFMHNYSLSRRIAMSAVPAFLKLCEFAGLVEKGSVLTRKRGGEENNKIRNVVVSRRSVSTQADYGQNPPIPFAGGKIKVSFPPEALEKMSFDDKFNTDWKKLAKDLSDFANKYFGERTNKDDE